MILASRNGRGDSLVLEGRVLAPAQRIDECLRITVSEGVIAAIEPALTDGAVTELLDGSLGSHRGGD